MTPRARRIALVCMTPETDTDELSDMELPSYGIRRIHAALVADPALAGAEIALIDIGRADAAAYVAAIEDFEPDLVGFSAYVWSTPCLVEAARRIKRARPGCRIVFGGPSARPEMFDLAPFAGAEAYLDAVVASEGEHTFRDIARLPDLDPAALAAVAGLHLPGRGGWRFTGARAANGDLDGIASPFQLGLMARNTVAYLETYRGCPMSCRFCAWGASDKRGRVFSADYLARELEAYAANDVTAVFLVDAGLNLNLQGFRNLAAAERRVGFFRDTALWCEVYPTHLRDEHVDFLAGVRAGYLGIGLQSTDADVLRLHRRPFDHARFAQAVDALAPAAHVEIQIIFGLPGDSPGGFRRTLDYARSFGVAVRAYHCLVLPDALMSRGLPEWDMVYDPFTLEMISCLGWSQEALAEMRAYMSGAAAAAGGMAGDFWWYFP